MSCNHVGRNGDKNKEINTSCEETQSKMEEAAAPLWWSAEFLEVLNVHVSASAVCDHSHSLDVSVFQLITSQPCFHTRVFPDCGCFDQHKGYHASSSFNAALQIPRSSPSG